MLPACLRLADDIFPRVRAHAARRLVDAGWSQTRIGQTLGLSQAMISKHLASPPASDPLVERLADELAQEALQPKPFAGESPWCGTLTQTQQSSHHEVALQDILAAERLLASRPPLAVLPQVGLNLAVAIPTATDPSGIIAFPGRLIEAGGRLLRPAPPMFGGSGHLARVLLALRQRHGYAAIANVRGGSQVMAAARRLGWTVQLLERASTSTSEAPLLAAIAAGRKPLNALHDPGAVGLEACLYIAGPDAQAVAQQILALQEELQ